MLSYLCFYPFPSLPRRFTGILGIPVTFCIAEYGNISLWVLFLGFSGINGLLGSLVVLGKDTGIGNGIGKDKGNVEFLWGFLGICGLGFGGLWGRGGFWRSFFEILKRQEDTAKHTNANRKTPNKPSKSALWGETCLVLS